jgi:hypothetical protein
MENSESVGKALSDLKKRGYDADLNFEENPFGLYSGDLDMRLNPEEFHVDETVRVDDGIPSDEKAVVYAISSSSGIKGTVVEEQNIKGTVGDEKNI